MSFRLHFLGGRMAVDLAVLRWDFIDFFVGGVFLERVEESEENVQTLVPQRRIRHQIKGPLIKIDYIS